jgi:hypothetical protein
MDDGHLPAGSSTLKTRAGGGGTKPQRLHGTA